MPKESKLDWKMLSMVFQAHPWHGVAIGEEAPQVVQCYIEIVPSDSIKYELDKATGLLKIDRPQRYSNFCPSLYGFIPQTYCGKRVAEYSMRKTGLKGLEGDGDALDICVITEKNITHGDLLVKAVPIGGFRGIDGREADDKIIAVMEQDLVYGEIRDMCDCPTNLIERLKHYFLTYKDVPGEEERRQFNIHGEHYGAKEAFEVIRRAQQDYQARYPEMSKLLAKQAF